MSAFVGYMVYNCISEIIKEYLIPSLETVKTRYEVSEVMAGVTILAFGNGAGDVITALVASSYPGGLDFNIGATMGAGFVTLNASLVPLLHRRLHHRQQVQISHQDGPTDSLAQYRLPDNFNLCHHVFRGAGTDLHVLFAHAVLPLLDPSIPCLLPRTLQANRRQEGWFC